MPPPVTTAAPPTAPMPWATLSFALLFVGMAIAGRLIDQAAFDHLRLQYGALDPFTPLQLVASVFITDGLPALALSLIGLALTGPLVEQRLGYRRFQGLWLLLSLVSGGIELWLCGGEEPADPGHGAARVLWGLAACAAVIAPLRPLRPLPRALQDDGDDEVVVPAVAVAGLWAAFGLVLMLMDGAPAVRGVLGVLPGLLAGLAIAPLGWSSAPREHLLSLLRRRAAPADPDLPPDPATMSRAEQALREEHLDSIAELLRAGAMEAAFSAWQLNGGDRLSAPPELRARLLAGLAAAGRWNEAKTILASFPDPGQRPAGARLAEIQILVHDKRPQKAFERLSALQQVPLTAAQKTLAQGLAAEVQRLQREGVLEMDD